MSMYRLKLHSLPFIGRLFFLVPYTKTGFSKDQSDDNHKAIKKSMNHHSPKGWSIREKEKNIGHNHDLININ